MTQCAKIIVGFMANVGNVFYRTFTNVFFLIFPTFFTFLTFFKFHLNVCYIYDLHHTFEQTVRTAQNSTPSIASAIQKLSDWLTSDMGEERRAAADIRRSWVCRRGPRYSCTVHRDAGDAATRSTRSRASERRCAARRRTCPAAAGSASPARSPAPRRTEARTCWRAVRSSWPVSAPDGNSSQPALPAASQTSMIHPATISNQSKDICIAPYVANESEAHTGRD